MGTQRHEALYAEAVTEVFAALLTALALRRWGPDFADASGLPLPRKGARYARQTKTSLRTGRVLEVIRPVSITLYETLDDPPCHVRLKLRWRIHPLETGSLLRLDMHYQLNRAATLRSRHWSRELRRHATRMFHFVAVNIERQQSRAAASSNRS